MTYQEVLEKAGVTFAKAPPATDDEVNFIHDQLPETRDEFNIVYASCPRCGKELSVDVFENGWWATRMDAGTATGCTSRRKPSLKEFKESMKTRCLLPVCGFQATAI